MFYIYILKCSDNSLYTGYTNDLDKRISMHNSGKGSKYVFAHKPFTLIYSESFYSKSEAMKREAEIKKWNREKKIRTFNLELLID